MPQDATLTSDCETTELPDGTTRRVYQYDWGPEKKSRKQNGSSGGYNFDSPRDEQEAELRLLRCHSAVIERENRALRDMNEGMARRISKLELELFELRKK